MTVNEAIRSSTSEKLSAMGALLILQHDEIMLTQISEYETNKRAYCFNLQRARERETEKKETGFLKCISEHNRIVVDQCLVFWAGNLSYKAIHIKVCYQHWTLDHDTSLQLALYWGV